MNSEEKIEALSMVQLFSRVGRSDIERIAGIATESSHPAGAAIVTEGEVAPRMFLIVDGTVEVTQERDGKSIAINTIGKGGSFGELALFENASRNATVRAMTDVSCLVLSDEDVYGELRETPSVAVGLMKVLVRRIRTADAELARLKAAAGS
jgi:CRP-like cAMP-binding protein